MCGNYGTGTPWTGLEMALFKMKGHPPLSADSQVLMGALILFRLRERQGRPAVPRMLLMQALLDSRRSLATEPRDKIYALLGLTRDGSEVVVPVPQSLSTRRDAEIYVDVARHFVANKAIRPRSCSRPTRGSALARRLGCRSGRSGL